MTYNQKILKEVNDFQIALLKRLSFEWDQDHGAYYGSPTVNQKRPYGNSDVLRDLREIYAMTLGFEYVEPEDNSSPFFVLKDGVRLEASTVDATLWSEHANMPIVLEIMCSNPTDGITKGVYVKNNPYSHKWELFEIPTVDTFS